MIDFTTGVKPFGAPDIDPETPALSVFSVGSALSVVHILRIARLSTRSAF